MQLWALRPAVSTSCTRRECRGRRQSRRGARRGAPWSASGAGSRFHWSRMLSPASSRMARITTGPSTRSQHTWLRPWRQKTWPRCALSRSQGSYAARRLLSHRHTLLLIRARTESPPARRSSLSTPAAHRGTRITLHATMAHGTADDGAGGAGDSAAGADARPTLVSPMRRAALDQPALAGRAVSMYALQSVRLWRKYLGLLDFCMTILTPQ